MQLWLRVDSHSPCALVTVWVFCPILKPTLPHGSCSWVELLNSKLWMSVPSFKFTKLQHLSSEEHHSPLLANVNSIASVLWVTVLPSKHKCLPLKVDVNETLGVDGCSHAQTQAWEYWGANSYLMATHSWGAITLMVREAEKNVRVQILHNVVEVLKFQYFLVKKCIWREKQELCHSIQSIGWFPCSSLTGVWVAAKKECISNLLNFHHFAVVRTMMWMMSQMTHLWTRSG